MAILLQYLSIFNFTPWTCLNSHRVGLEQTEHASHRRSRTSWSNCPPLVKSYRLRAISEVGSSILTMTSDLTHSRKIFLLSEHRTIFWHFLEVFSSPKPLLSPVDVKTYSFHMVPRCATLAIFSAMVNTLSSPLLFLSCGPVDATRKDILQYIAL